MWCNEWVSSNVECFKWMLSFLFQWHAFYFLFKGKCLKSVFPLLLPIYYNYTSLFKSNTCFKIDLILPPRWLVSVHVRMMKKYTCTDLNRGWQTVDIVIIHTEHLVCSTVSGQSHFCRVKQSSLVQFKDTWHLTFDMTDDFEIR